MKAAFLSSSLISSKGSAGPATQSMLPKELLATSERAKKIYSGSRSSNPDPQPSASVSDPGPQESNNSLLVSTPKSAKIKEETVVRQARASSNMRKDALGRVRMSIRMTPEQHLNLKLISAHSRLSSQAIIEDALKEYVEKHGTDLIPDACACIKDKFFS
ncbi:hypothetical protein [Sneathiella sp.]|jgi:hypothetical protein|uniref:hypothetical protein n=1 Tax=Sneathiella sp. TaxID=1964365 RepID=UPI0039E36AF9